MILIILAVALILRLIVLNQSLWLDEAINVNNAASLGFRDLIFNYSLGDFHPPLYHVILRAWILLFGTSEISVRSPSVIFGVATVLIIFLIAKKLYGVKTAFIGATLLATAPLHIYYSQEARMYMLAAFLASLSVYFFTLILDRDRVLFWVGFVISSALMLYVDYLPYFMIPVYILYLVFNKKRIAKSTFNAFAPAFLLIFILVLPWLFVLPNQLAIGLSAAAASPAWAHVVGAPDLKTFLITFVKFTIGRISIDNDLTYVLTFAPIGIFVSLLFLLSFFRMSAKRSFLLWWFFGPLFLAFVFGYFIPVFSYFRFIFILPAFYLIWASAINTVNWTPLVRLLLIIGLAINLTSSAIYFINPKFQRENWRDAVDYVKSNSSKKTVVFFESRYTVAPFDYYNRGEIPAEGAIDTFNPSEKNVAGRIRILTKDFNKVFLFQYLGAITDPAGVAFKELTAAGFVNKSTKDFNGVGFVYEFERGKVD